MASDDRYVRFFEETDKDGSGYLTLEELIVMLRRHGYKEPDEKIARMFDSFDSSGDKKISMDEYLQGMGQMPAQNHKSASARYVFRQFDRNGDGCIDRSELSAVFKEMGRFLSPAEVDSMFRMMDSDGSGSLNYEEFITKVFGKC